MINQSSPEILCTSLIIYVHGTCMKIYGEVTVNRLFLLRREIKISLFSATNAETGEIISTKTGEVYIFLTREEKDRGDLINAYKYLKGGS